MDKIFLLTKDLDENSILTFRNNMAEEGIEVSKASSYDDDNVLFVTDRKEIADSLLSKGVTPLILIYEESDADEFTGYRYFVMDITETCAEYFIKVYERIHDIPWDIGETERLKIRETVESDVDSFYEIYKDPEMTLYTEKLYESVDEEKKYVREYRDKVYAMQEFGIWTLIKKDSGEIIGRAGLVTRSGFPGVELGFAIAKKYWHQGYGTEAVSFCIGFALDHDLGPIQALVMDENEASKALLKKTGLKEKEKITLDGEEYVRWVYMD